MKPIARLACLSLLVACHAGPADDAASVRQVVATSEASPSPDPPVAQADAASPAPAPVPFTLDPARNSVTLWANTSRSSHLDVAMRDPGSLDRVAEIEPDARKPADGDWNVLLASPAYVVALRSHEFRIFDRTRGQWRATGAHGNTSATLTTSGIFFVNREVDFDGRDTGRVLLGYPEVGEIERSWVQEIRGNNVVLLRQFEQTLPGWRAFEWQVVTPPIAQANPKLAVPLPPSLGGRSVEHTRAGGAMFDDGSFAMVSTEGRVAIFGPAAPPDSLDLPIVVDRHVAMQPYEVAVTHDRIAALEAVGVPPLKLNAHGVATYGPYTITGELAWNWHGFGTRPDWPTRLLVLDRQAQFVATATMPFPVLQPPIDGENGRFYLAGFGFAAVEGNKVLYARPSKAQCFATALRGGDVVVADGPELRFVKRDGTVRETFKVGDGEAILAAPAVAEDGTVWVTTARALYVAR